ncbi:probable disease resistance protein At5g45440 [Primulina huaijiensis]|uniref:probable disease resistance protein At5g45440 n=1 Tax=Primulina huaijiensis TaxID=1492673 RepID=UPI003CC70D62
MPPTKTTKYRNMEDIENFLLEQLEKAIEDVKQPSTVFDECSRLKDLIKARKVGTGAADDATRKQNLYYLNNIVAEWQAVLKKHNHCSPTAQITLNGQLPERLKKIRKELEEPAEQKDETSSKHKEKVDEKAAHKVEASQDKEKYNEKYRGLENPYHVDRSKIWGIDDKSKAMERLLVRKDSSNNGFRAIGIVGMTGVGKTTFCQVSFNNEEVKKHFLPRIWVEMSKQPENDDDYKKEVVKSFLRSLGFEDSVIDEIGAESEGLDLLLLALRKQLQGKRYLVVLDDIWHLDKRFKEFCSSLSKDDEKYEARLSYGLPKGSGGCVIVTSRSESWAVDMVGEKNLHRLTPLEDKKSIWKIYTDTIEEKGYYMDPDMEKAEEEIVKRCAGLPLIAKMLGETAVKTFVGDKGKEEGSETNTK